MEERFLIVGLGNPGREYEKTRHNVGFRVVKALAAKYGLIWKSSLVRAKGNLTEGKISERRTLLLMPLTFMNESGASVRKTATYYKVPPEQTIVVADDIALPFGKLRLRDKGGSGGHNGLKSITAHMGTDTYGRLRIGVGDREEGDLSDYVLGRFTEEEQKMLLSITNDAIAALEVWLKEGIEAARQMLGEK